MLAVQGEPPEDGLAAYGEDLMMAVARKIVSGDEEDVEMVEDVFAQAREPKGLIIARLVQGWCVGPRVSHTHGFASSRNGAGGAADLHPTPQKQTGHTGPAAPVEEYRR